ncbi:MAG: SOS response-associated peptidase [Candidatus Dadabacteria bacterium]|nr:SOS response-associated peptidase [Candidatus Dadabacteria bacterium]
MPGRFSQTTELEVLKDRFRFPSNGITLNPRYNIAPGQLSPIVIKDGGNNLKMMRWGLVPSWAKDASIGYKMINARAETLTQKPSFKNSFKERRCLVIADGFYEWEKSEKKVFKIPYRFVLRSREPFAFAGLWDSWKAPDGSILLSFTIITIEPNDLMKPIHDRMPVLLKQSDEDIWLDNDFRDVEKLFPLLAPYPSQMMEAYEVSTLVNSPKNDTPECVKPKKSVKESGLLSFRL